MNIYGLLFSFMVPGILIGILLGSAFTKRKRTQTNAEKATARRFVTFDLNKQTVSKLNGIPNELELFPCTKKRTQSAANF